MSENKLERHARLDQDQKAELAGRVKELYVSDGLSIRQISEETGRSYGAVHRLLIDNGVTLRPRGKPTPTS